MPNIFQDPTKRIPKQDAQIVRVPMKENEIAGRTDHLPSGGRAGDMALSHVSNAGTTR